jgi:hypothetical protein
MAVYYICLHHSFALISVFSLQGLAYAFLFVSSCSTAGLVQHILGPCRVCISISAHLLSVETKGRNLLATPGVEAQ